MKIDCHFHLPKGEGYQEQHSKTLENVRSVGIDKICVSIIGATTPDEFRERNSVLRESTKAHPDAILGYSFVNPSQPRPGYELEFP